jgi:hypothetical protein
MPICCRHCRHYYAAMPPREDDAPAMLPYAIDAAIIFRRLFSF